MTDDASTAYICIYCPFNSDNLEALEDHLARTHEYGCQEVLAPSAQSLSTSSNIVHKASKREAPDDEQTQLPLNGIKQTAEYSSGAKRIKRTLSPTSSANVYINGTNDNSGDDDEYSDDEDDERDSSSNLINLSSNTTFTCPICKSTYHHLAHLVQHAKRKHQLNLSDYDGPQTFEMLTTLINQNEKPETELNQNSTEVNNPVQIEEINLSKKPSQSSNELTASSTTDSNAINDCYYCDYKTNNIEELKSHIIAHIRDKNYRCLLCNRLYKYRGDCSFHIRRKHHRYSANSNDYIQRFLFDTSDGGDETMLTQSGGQRSSTNGSNHTNHSSTREQEEPVRYFGCPYCDYTSNYGGDVRKHQARKHPNVESKVLKIIRQDSEPQVYPVLSMNHHSSLPNENGGGGGGGDDDDHDDEHDNHSISKSIPNSTEQSERKEKIKTVKKTDPTIIQPYSSALPIIPNFAPVRVFQCSSCHQQGTYKWVVERHIRAKHPDQPDAHVIELPAELAVKLQKITPPLKRFRCSLCPLQSKHTWVIIRHIKHFHTLQTASVLDIQPDGTPIHDESFSVQNGDFSGKSYNHDSESSSPSSLYIETGAEGQNDIYPSQDMEDEDDENDQTDSNTNEITILTYKCSACDFHSNIQWNTQKHIQDFHSGQVNVHILTQCRSMMNDNHSKNLAKKSKHKINSTTIATVTKMPLNIPLSPTSALTKSKFCPAVEEALLSLQGAKINSGMYAVQPKFGIKRLKCRHCFYRSNWKTDMIRHVRIRHSLSDPDHNKDMIMMSEQEARSTIETYENTFGKELRRRTFRTWNDWAKAEEEFTPKDGSLQYTDAQGGIISVNEINKPKKQSTGPISSSMNDETKRLNNKPKIKQETTKIITQNVNPIMTIKKEEIKSIPNPSNIVSRLLLSASPSHHTSNDDDGPLDLSLKSSSSKEINRTIENDKQDDEDEPSDESSTIQYQCSVCSYKHSNLSAIQRHISLHLTGQGVVCPLCSYTTFTNQSMINHMTQIHPTSQLITNYPSVNRISTATILEQYQCPQCSYQCDCSETLDLHRRLEHNDEEQYDIDSSSNTTVHDDDDDDGGDENHIDDDNDDDHIQLPVDTNNNLFQCPFCLPQTDAHDYSNLEQFTIHLFTNHLNHINNNQSCPFCSFIAHTTSTYSLIEHIKLHFNGTLVQPDAIHGMENVKELFIE